MKSPHNWRNRDEGASMVGRFPVKGTSEIVLSNKTKKEERTMIVISEAKSNWKEVNQ